MGEFTFRLKLNFKNASGKLFGAFFLHLIAWLPAHAQTPVASFTADTTTGCVPLTVNFVNQSVLATSYFWRFGNGNTSTLQNPSATYTLPGAYTVTLIATNSSSGQVDSISMVNYINVVNYPTANFTTANTDICEGASVCFTNSSINATNYAWDFGDGNSSTQTNPCHQYSTPGTYTVKLIAYSSFNCNDIKIKPAYITVHALPIAQINCNQTSSCDVNQVFSFTCPTAGATAWQWNFGDPGSGANNTSSVQNPTHVFSAIGTYTVSLIVINSFGCTDTLINTNYITIGNSLVPNFNVNAAGGCAPFTASFTCPIPNATSWQWNFGDPGSGAGNTSVSQSPNHTYTNPGQYTIILTVNTASGCNGTATYTNYITVDQMPTANFTITNNTGCAPATIQFNNTSSASATSWLWDFGNTDTSTLQNPSNVYNTTGTYTVTLNAYTPNGCHAVHTVNNAVTVYGAVAGFQGNPKIGCAPLTSNFSANAYAGTVSWLWDFGDPASGASNTSTLQATTHTFNSPGLYAIKLITTTNQGCVDTFRVNGYIKVYSGQDTHTVDSIGGCTPLPVSFTDPTQGSTQWHWDFGDPTLTNDTSNIKNPSYIYNTPGTYTVSLVTNMPGGVNGTGCQQIFSPYAVVTVLPLIVSPITFVQASPCAPFVIQFSDTTSGVAHWSWNFGDGSPPDTNQTPAPHTYLQPGTYSVTLQIVMLTGCMTTTSTSVTVGHPNPISISNHGPCRNTPVSFSVNNASAFTNVTWNFGDATAPSNLFNTTHNYLTVGNFAVSLTTTDNAGCVYTYHDTVKVTNPQPSFTITSPTIGCGILNVTFNNTSTGSGTYVWNFGDGDSSSLTNPTHLYDSVGTYTVNLTMTNNNCVKSYSFPTQISVGNAIANFSMTQNSYCEPVSATFTDLSTNPVYWHWDFGNGDTSNLQSPTYVYSSPPSGNVTLIITDNNGCSDTISQPNVIFLHAAFSVDDSAGCHPFIANFTDLSDSSAVSWHWIFGDGTTSNQHNPTHTYTAVHDTTYTVTLITTFASGCTDTVSYTNFITISSPQADFITPTSAACAPSLINFTNLSTQSVSYEWDFGDQVTSTLIDPAHIYNIPGYYTITLIATDAVGCKDTMTKTDYIYIPGTYSYFTINTLSYCFGTTVQFSDSSINAMQWHWDFGDGYADSSQNPLHVYADTGCYTVSLITSDSIGCSSIYANPNQVCVHPIPNANATTADTVGCKSFTSSFTELAQNEISYLWMFGDGDTSALANPTHLYDSAGVYNVTLVAYNQWGCTDTFTLTSPVIVHQTPVAQFTKSVATGCNPLTVQFTNTSIDTVNSTYNWSFGDGQFSTLANPSNVYADSGTYTIQLIVTNAGNCTDTSYSSITVHKTPTANASTANVTGCSPYFVTFNNLSVNATSYQWQFGDNQTSTQAVPTHVYADSGTYYVQLIVGAGFGCRDTFHFTTPIIVNKTPVAAFTPSITNGCNPLSVSFTNNSTDTVNSIYSWAFGDGQTSSQMNSSNVYADSGNYTVQLVVTNPGNCTDTTYTFINVHKTPTANATTADITGCSPYTVNFSNLSVDADSYLWIFGDNQTSTLANPSHVYADSGTFYVQLIASTIFGCSDTFDITTPIIVNKTPAAAFMPASLVTCAPANVTFTNTSYDTFNPVFTWNIDTSTTNALNPLYTFADSGLYTVTLTIVNQGGCMDSVTHNVQVLPKPTAIALTTDTMGCNPLTSVFTNNSIDATSYLWDFGDNSTDTTTLPSHSYAAAGIYNVSLVAYNAVGCTDTMYLYPPITVLQTPTANFTVASSAQCSGSIYDFTNLSADTINPVYGWTIGNSITSSVTNPSIQLFNPGFYDVTLSVTNSNGCIDSLIKPFYIQVYDTLPPPADPIQSVSVVDDNSVRITWMNSMATDLAAYKLYRLDPASGNYMNVYTDNNPSNASLNPTSSYIETGLNTLQNTYTYKLQTLDRCNYALPLDSLLEHTTINVTATTAGKDIDINWTPYGGCTIASYTINRFEAGSTIGTIVGTVPGNQLSFTDTTLQCPFPYSYRIQGISLCGDTATSWSDTSTATPINQLANQHADVVRSTVVFDRSVLTEWAVPVLHPERVIAYNILRSTDSVNYYQIAQVPVGNTSYVDDDVLVHEQHYYYKIDVVNDCNLTGIIETNSSSILLKGEWLNDRSHLWWTKYDKWDTGVDHYSIEKINKYGQWEEIKIIPGNGATDVELDE